MSCNHKTGYFNTPSSFYDFDVKYTIDTIHDIDSFHKSLSNFIFFYKNISGHPLSTTRNGEYFTPLERVNNILNRLESVYPDIFNDPSHTFLDPCCGLGQFQVLLFFRLLERLVNKFDGDYQACTKHILKNMIYVIDINSGNIDFLTTKVFIGLKHAKTADALNTNVFSNIHFTCVLFNPPFSVYHSNSSTTLYPSFCTSYLPRGKISCCIIPNIWICSSRLKYFIKWMKKQPIYSITEYIDPSKYFKLNIQLHGYIEEIITINGNDIIDANTINDIKQGYKYTLVNNETGNEVVLREDFVLYNSNIDIYIHTNKFDKMLIKILNYINKNGSILNIFYGTTYYDVSTNDKRLHTPAESDNDALCYIATRRGVHSWINKDQLFKRVYKRVFKQKMKATDTDDLFVITAYTTPHDKDAFVKLYICNKGEVYNASYIGFKVNSLAEADSLISYLSTDLVKTLLLLRKQTISISKFQLQWIPLVPLDREWTNSSVLEWFKIDNIPKEIL